MRRKALSPPVNSARLRMLAYCLKVHRVRFVACLDALKSTQACRTFFRLLDFDSRFAFDFSLRAPFRQNLTFLFRTDGILDRQAVV